MLTAMLAKLAQHYYRPDFTEGQARQLIRDYLTDLAEFALQDVDAGITAYRRDPRSKFFPTIGQLRERVTEAQKERLASERHSRVASLRPQFGDSRPNMWWMLPVWNPRWREDEIPEEHRKEWARRRAAKVA